VLNIIRKLKNRKAPGPDGIPNEVLKQLPIIAVKYFTSNIHAIRRCGFFPHSWKEAKVIMLPKPGKTHSDPNNYRPISILNCLSKLAEKLS
jgi:hypothetical protein